MTHLISEKPREFTWPSLETESQEMAHALLDRSGSGIIRVTASATEPPLSLYERKSIILRWASIVGTPIVVYKRCGLWKHIGVSLHCEPDRAGGVGEIPLHIDLVNASLPPDFVVFLCEKGAGGHGGQSVVSSFLPALRSLSSDLINDLSQVMIREGRFFDLENVGQEKNPFPLLDKADQRINWIRYTGKSKTEIVQGSREAVRLFGEGVRAGEIEFDLTTGDAFVINQHLAAHGRRCLRTDQGALLEVMQRSLWQLFIRGHSQ